MKHVIYTILKGDMVSGEWQIKSANHMVFDLPHQLSFWVIEKKFGCIRFRYKFQNPIKAQCLMAHLNIYTNKIFLKLHLTNQASQNDSWLFLFFSSYSTFLKTMVFSSPIPSSISHDYILIQSTNSLPIDHFDCLIQFLHYEIQFSNFKIQFKRLYHISNRFDMFPGFMPILLLVRMYLYYNLI